MYSSSASSPCSSRPIGLLKASSQCLAHLPAGSQHDPGCAHQQMLRAVNCQAPSTCDACASKWQGPVWQPGVCWVAAREHLGQVPQHVAVLDAPLAGRHLDDIPRHTLADVPARAWGWRCCSARDVCAWTAVHDAEQRLRKLCVSARPGSGLGCCAGACKCPHASLAATSSC